MRWWVVTGSYRQVFRIQHHTPLNINAGGRKKRTRISQGDPPVGGLLGFFCYILIGERSQDVCGLNRYIFFNLSNRI